MEPISCKHLGQIGGFWVLSLPQYALIKILQVSSNGSVYISDVLEGYKHHAF